MRIIIFSILDVLATQREGEECGSCLNPDKNFFCGNCSVGLECVKGPVIDILLDAPSRCKKIKGMILLSKQVNEVIVSTGT